MFSQPVLDLTVRYNGQTMGGADWAIIQPVWLVCFIWRKQSLVVQRPPPPTCGLWANVGEEGLGNLQVCGRVVDRFGQNAVYIVIEGGLWAARFHIVIGVCRFRIDVTSRRSFLG
ncbi:MAG: hypothetical protein H6669_15255 [Ardenticatenaceae bacterium]|nr:hypothetical protein [Ardenticatenaceae bacterium]